MLQNNPNKLIYLMEIFKISGVELAKALHVDHSLVSKWKNSKRPLSPRSNYIRRIADYFLSLDNVTKYKRIKEVLKDEYPGVLSDDISVINDAFCSWLSSSSSCKTQGAFYSTLENSSDMHISEVGIFHRITGRREAVLNFLDYAISLPEGQRLLLLSQEDMSWMVEDLNFLRLMRNKLIDIIARKNKITIMHTVDRDERELAPILLQWLPLHATGSIDSFYSPNYVNTSLKTTLFIIEGEAVVSGFTAVDFTKNLFTYYSFDMDIIKHSQDLYKMYLSKCRPLMEKYPLNCPQKLFGKVSASEAKAYNSIIYAKCPLFFTLPEETLKTVLEQNGLEKEKMHAIMQMKKKSSAAFYESIQSCLHRHVYDLEALRQLALSESYISQDLSIAAGSEIKLSRSHFHNHIENLIQLLNNFDNFEVGLTSGGGNERLLNAWIKENTVIIAYSAVQDPLYSHAVSTSEPTLVNAFFHYYEEVWDSIPRIYRKKDWIIETLKKIIH